MPFCVLGTRVIWNHRFRVISSDVLDTSFAGSTGCFQFHDIPVGTFHFGNAGTFAETACIFYRKAKSILLEIELHGKFCTGRNFESMLTWSTPSRAWRSVTTSTTKRNLRPISHSFALRKNRESSRKNRLEYLKTPGVQISTPFCLVVVWYRLVVNIKAWTCGICATKQADQDTGGQGFQPPQSWEIIFWSSAKFVTTGVLCGKLECLAALCRLASPHSWVHSLQGEDTCTWKNRGWGEIFFTWIWKVFKMAWNVQKCQKITREKKMEVKKNTKNPFFLEMKVLKGSGGPWMDRQTNITA